MIILPESEEDLLCECELKTFSFAKRAAQVGGAKKPKSL